MYTYFIVVEVIKIKIIKYGAVWCMSCIVMDNVIKQLSDKYEFDYISYDFDNDKDKFLNFNKSEKLPIIEFVDDNDKVLKKINGEHSKSDIESILTSLEVKLK